MGVYRMHTDSAGDSRIDELTETEERIAAGGPADPIRFRQIPDGRFQDRHTPTRRHFRIMLAGQLEIGLKNGTWKLGPGDAVLVEDMTGTGHTSTWTGDGGVVVAVVDLP